MLIIEIDRYYQTISNMHMRIAMNTLKTTFLMALLTVLLVLIGGAIGGKGA